MNSNILFLTQILPYPPDSGPKVKTYHVLRYLAQQGYTIYLASFVRQDEVKYIDELRNICKEVYPVSLKRSRIKDLVYFLQSQFSGRPFLIERDDIKEMRLLVNEVVKTKEIDFIHADQLTMTLYGLPFTNQEKPKLVFDAHNAVWTIVERMKDTNFYLRPILGLEAYRIKRYESMIVEKFTHTLAVSDVDKDALLEAVYTYNPNYLDKEPSITVTPIAVDTDVLKPANRKFDSLDILTMGTLYYPPNADGIRWFVREVFPHIKKEVPSVTLTIVGKNPPQDFINTAKESEGSIIVTGYVDNLDPYFDQSALIVIPVRAGGGIRVRILEAFARGTPVVTTSVGLEGINAEIGKDVLVADEPIEFANMVIRLLSDETLQHSLAENGRQLVEQKYDWQVILKEMEHIYPTLV